MTDRWEEARAVEIEVTLVSLSNTWLATLIVMFNVPRLVDQLGRLWSEGEEGREWTRSVRMYSKMAKRWNINKDMAWGLLVERTRERN